MAFASGKYAYRISDRSGFRYKIKDTRKEWNGSIVGKDEYEEKHPQLEPANVRADNEAIREARPDRTETAVPNLLPLNPFSTTVSSATVTVNEPNHGRSTNDTVRFRDANNYSFPAGVSATFTQKGGGGSASAGPTSITS